MEAIQAVKTQVQSLQAFGLLKTHLPTPQSLPDTPKLLEVERTATAQVLPTKFLLLLVLLVAPLLNSHLQPLLE